MKRSKPALRRDNPPPEDYSKPGYYKHHSDDRDDYFRWFDGKSWVGPDVSLIWVALYTKLVEWGANPQSLRIMTWMFSSVVLFLILVFLLGVVFNWFEGSDDEPAASLATSVVTSTTETQVTSTVAPATTATPLTSTAAPVTTAMASEGVASIDTSGVWTFTWSWGVTVVGFDGEVTGEGSQWTFQGKYARGGSSSRRPESGTATCTLSGEPLANLSTPGSMSCNVTVPEDSWTGETTGQINLVLGEVTKFEYRGGGTGTSSSTSGSPIEVHLRPTG